MDGRHLETAWWGPRPMRRRPWCCCTRAWAASRYGATFRSASPTPPAAACSPIPAMATASSDPEPLPWPVTYMHREAEQVLPGVLDRVGRAPLRPDRPFRRRLDRRDPCRQRRRSAARRHRADRPAFLHRGCRPRQHRRHPRSLRNRRPARPPRAPPRACGQCLPRLERRLARSATSAPGTSSTAWPRIDVPMLLLQGTQDEYGSAEQVYAAARDATAPAETVLMRRRRPRAASGKAGRDAGCRRADSCNVYYSAYNMLARRRICNILHGKI